MPEGFERLLPSPSPIEPTPAPEAKSALTTTPTEKGFLDPSRETIFQKQKRERQEAKAISTKIEGTDISAKVDVNHLEAYQQKKALEDEEVSLVLQGKGFDRIKAPKRDFRGNVIQGIDGPEMVDVVVAKDKVIVNEKGEEVTDPEERSFRAREQAIDLKRKYLLEDAVRATGDKDIATKKVDEFLISLYNTPEQRAKARQEVVAAKKVIEPNFVENPDDETLEDQVDIVVAEKAIAYKKNTLQKIFEGADFANDVFHANVDLDTFFSFLIGNETGNGRYGQTSGKESVKSIDVGGMLKTLSNKKRHVRNALQAVNIHNTDELLGDGQEIANPSALLPVLSEILEAPSENYKRARIFVMAFLISIGQNEASKLVAKDSKLALSALEQMTTHFK